MNNDNLKAKDYPSNKRSKPKQPNGEMKSENGFSEIKFGDKLEVITPGTNKILVQVIDGKTGKKGWVTNVYSFSSVLNSEREGKISMCNSISNSIQKIKENHDKQ